MSRICKLAPELHVPVMSFLQVINQLHQQGGGEFSLIEFVSALAPILVQDISPRATTSLSRTGPTFGTFQNSGSALHLKHDLITVNVPENIAGSYTCFPESVTFMFQEQQTIVGQAFLFKAKLLEVDANQYKLDVDLSGDSFDQCFIHSTESAGA